MNEEYIIVTDRIDYVILGRPIEYYADMDSHKLVWKREIEIYFDYTGKPLRLLIELSGKDGKEAEVVYDQLIDKIEKAHERGSK